LLYICDVTSNDLCLKCYEKSHCIVFGPYCN